MAKYYLSAEAKEDLIRIHQFGMTKFGEAQADLYIHSLFEHFDRIADRPFSFESVDHIRPGYRRCVVGPDSIYFRLSDGRVDIMAIVGRQDLNTLL
jgi:toxin ParE1/3/4